jgi:hypothetical protein
VYCLSTRIVIKYSKILVILFLFYFIFFLFSFVFPLFFSCFCFQKGSANHKAGLHNDRYELSFRILHSKSLYFRNHTFLHSAGKCNKRGKSVRRHGPLRCTTYEHVYIIPNV